MSPVAVTAVCQSWLLPCRHSGTGSQEQGWGWSTTNQVFLPAVSAMSCGLPPKGSLEQGLRSSLFSFKCAGTKR